MKTSEFVEVIKKLDPRFSVVENQNRIGLSNILFEDTNYDLPVLPSEEIREKPDPSYYYTFPNGYSAPFNDQETVLRKLNEFLADLENRKTLYEETKEDSVS